MPSPTSNSGQDLIRAEQGSTITTAPVAAAVIPARLTLNDAIALGDIFAKSGFFADSREAAQCVTKIIAGQEMGIGAIAAMTGIYIVKNKVQVGANILAGLVKRSVRYDYRVKKLSDTECEITFFERDPDGKFQIVGESVFTEADAKKAEVGNLTKFPRNMLFARAMSNGVKWFCADVTGGTTVYTPGELPDSAPADVLTGEVLEAAPVADDPVPVADDPNVTRMKAKKRLAAICNEAGIAFNDRAYIHWLCARMLTLEAPISTTKDLSIEQISAVADAIKQSDCAGLRAAYEARNDVPEAAAPADEPDPFADTPDVSR